MSEPAPAAPRPSLPGVILRWLGAALVVGAIFCWLAGLSGTGLLLIGGGLALIAGMAVGLWDQRARPDGAPAPTPSPIFAMLVLVMAVFAFLIGAGQTMGSAPSSANDMLIGWVSLFAALVLIVAAVVAFAEPRFRYAMALFSIAIVGGLVMLTLAIV